MSPEALLYSIYIVDLNMSSHYSICLYPHRPRQKKPQVENIDINLEILKELRKEPEAPLKPEFDEDDLFGQRIGATLKKMPEQQKALAKMKIQQVLYEIQYCNVQPVPFYPSQDNNSVY